MKKSILLLICLITINSCCQESDTAILEKTISQLNKIETVFYQSTFKAVESGTTYSENVDSIFFDFTNHTQNLTPKYFIKNEQTELIYNGEKSIQSMIKEKLIVTEDAPNANNPLYLTLFPIKELLPKMISNVNITITRKKDTLINNKEGYFFEFLYKGGTLDFNNLNLKSNPDARFDKKYILIINKSDYLPSLFIMPNGQTGSASRTFDNLNFDYKLDKNVWTGEHLPSEYKKITFEQFAIKMMSKRNLGQKKALDSTKNQKIGTWIIPNLKSNELVDFSKFKGKVVLLEFWFRFCGPCVKAVPHLNELNQKLKNENFLLYGVEFREEAPKDVLQEYVSKIEVNYPNLYKGGELASTYSVQSAPTFMIIDKEGNIIYLESGFHKDKIESIIKKHL